MRAYLEHFPEQGGPAKRVEITKNPFVMGRSQTADLTIYSHKVSKDHALIAQDSGRYLVRDLRSTNGTFANGKRIDEAHLVDGDIIHVAHWEFCFCLAPAIGLRCGNTASLTQESDTGEKESLIRLITFLRQLVAEELVAIVFQPIVDLRTNEIVGFEALGRGSHHQLHQSPVKLFQLAEKCEMEGDLCRLFRTQALKIGATLPSHFRLFINLHPSQLARSDSLDWLNQLSRQNGGRHQLVIELSEQAKTSVDQLRSIKRALRELGIELAYDDFGVGQARLLEIAECPPHFLKLDRDLVQAMHGSETSREMVRGFLTAIAGKGIRVIAEGIESEQAAEVCLQNGCHLGQGFLYGYPTSLLQIIASLDKPLHLSCVR
jgi:EAL domain-containing protein (putative c-di-GMP-specific phosphodiesterase class I)